MAEQDHEHAKDEKDRFDLRIKADKEMSQGLLSMMGQMMTTMKALIPQVAHLPPAPGFNQQQNPGPSAALNPHMMMAPYYQSQHAHVNQALPAHMNQAMPAQMNQAMPAQMNQPLPPPHR